ncbi:MAG: hypothetical protein IPG17_03205 [Sandaracinaceae bacterium]|nr:hypothetical protein [Sandaracinaceae bacterium]MBK8410519.1 hypothetical protein [Sandaracinaceae bacterium]
MFTAQGLRRALLSLLLISFSPLAQACGSSEAGSPEGPSGGAVPSTPSVPAVAEGADTPDPTAADPAPAAAAVEPAAEAVDGGAAAAEAPAAPAVARAHGPLAPEVRAHFEAMRPDPAPRAIIRSSHYYRTNELSHWVYRERVANVGGVMSGVGSDQLYLLAGWARPEILVPLDFDGEITATHRVVAAVFLAHATPEAFMAAFDEANVDALEALVRAHYASSPDVDSLARTARNAGRHLFESMRMIRRRYTERGVPTYITDAAQYEFVRGLWAEGRVFPIRGDLTADLAMLDLALAARRANLPVRLLYVSNAETYFEFGPTYRRNIMAQPFDDRSVLLRTFHSNLPHPDGEPNYHYSIESGPHAIRMMQRSSIDSVRTLLVRERSATNLFGLSEIIGEPSGPTPTIAPVPEGHPLAALWTPPAAPVAAPAVAATAP